MQDMGILFHQRNKGAMGVYCKSADEKPYKAVETRSFAVPRCTVVSDQNDVFTGGVGDRIHQDLTTPIRKLFPLSDRVCR